MLKAFDPEKTTQAAAVLLKQAAGQRMGRLRLLKLLYIADRESIQETGYPITGDDAVAMEHGPVLSRTYGCIKGGDLAASEWERTIQRVGPRDLQLVADPGVRKLSRYEVRKLQEVAERLDTCEDYQIVEYLHTLPEWKDNAPLPGSSCPIPVRDILRAAGHGSHEEAILEEARAFADFERAVSRDCARGQVPRGRRALGARCRGGPARGSGDRVDQRVSNGNALEDPLRYAGGCAARGQGAA